MPNRNQLAADMVNGTYVSEHSADCEVLHDMDFYDALAEDFEGTIYGDVSDEVAAMIESDFGIR